MYNGFEEFICCVSKIFKPCSNSFCFKNIFGFISNPVTFCKGEIKLSLFSNAVPALVLECFNTSIVSVYKKLVYGL